MPVAAKKEIKVKITAVDLGGEPGAPVGTPNWAIHPSLDGKTCELVVVNLSAEAKLVVTPNRDVDVGDDGDEPEPKK